MGDVHVASDPAQRCPSYLGIPVEIHVVLLDDAPALHPMAGHEAVLLPLLVEPALTISCPQVLTAHSSVCRQRK